MKYLAFAAVLLAACASAPAATETSDAPPVAREVSIQHDGFALAGTYLAPPGSRAPAVLLHPGSGPTDRDGNQRSFRTDALRLMAESIAEAGFPTLRIDKRGIGASAGTPMREEDLTLGVYAGDVRAWTTWLVEETGAPCVVLLGHSEGGLIATLAAAEDARVCGLVLAATLGRPAADVIAEQLRAATPEPILSQALEINAALARGERVEEVPPLLAPLFRPSVQPYLIDFYRIDPVEVLSRSAAPALVLQGDNDLQITEADARALGAARSGVEVVIVPGMNHVLRQAPRDRQGNAMTYLDPTLPLDPTAEAAILAFLAEVRANENGRR